MNFYFVLVLIVKSINAAEVENVHRYDYLRYYYVIQFVVSSIVIHFVQWNLVPI